MVKTSRTVVEIYNELHGQLKRLALLNDLRIHEVANTVISDFLQDEERVKATVKKLRSGRLQLWSMVASPSSRFARESYLHPANSFTERMQQLQA